MIPIQLKDAKFVKLIGKEAFEYGWPQNQKSQYDYETACRFLEQKFNYGVITGPQSGFGAIDADHPDYIQTIQDYLPPTFSVESTVDLKRHFYYKINNYPEGKQKICLKDPDGKRPEAGDIRFGNFYLVGPGSIHPDTKQTYRVKTDLPIAEIEFSLIKEVLSEFFQKPTHTENGKFHLAEKTKQGDRDKTLFRFACSLRSRNDMSFDQVLAAIKSYNKDSCEPPLDDVVVVQKVNQAFSYVEEPKIAPAGLGFIHVSELELKIPKWLIKNHIEEDTLTMMFGQPGAGKSFLGIGIACNVATGTPFFGWHVNQGGAFYIGSEGKNSIKRRITAWEIANNLKITPEYPFFASSRSAQLTNATNATEVADEIESIIQSTGVSPKIVIIDTLARNFGNGNENDTSDMNAFIRGLDIIRERFDCAVLTIHHTGHADKSRGRGGSSLRAALDFEYMISKNVDTGVVLMQSTKIKDFEVPNPMSFLIKQIDLDMADENGDPITSAVLDQIDYNSSAGLIPKGAKQQEILSVLRLEYARRKSNLGNMDYETDTIFVTEYEWRAAYLKISTGKNETEGKNFNRAVASFLKSGVIRFDGEGINKRVLLCE